MSNRPIIKKFVISKDRLPVNFPHYWVIYYILFNQGVHWSALYTILSSIVLILIIIFFVFRKTIEIPIKK